jgi:asparagine synthase (glutamine-hydrolysing)
LAGVARASFSGIPIEAMQRMAGAIRHRGPDGYGFFTDEHVGLAHVRLSIMDINR